MGSLVLGVVHRPSLFVRLRKPAAILLGVLLPALPVAGMALLDWPQSAPSVAPAVPSFPSGAINPMPPWPDGSAPIPIAKEALFETPPADPGPAITPAKPVVAKPATAAKPRLAAKPAPAPRANAAAVATARSTITTTPLAPPPPAPAAVVWVQTESAPAASAVDGEPPGVPTTDPAAAASHPAASVAVVNSSTGTGQTDEPQLDVSSLLDHLGKAISSGSGSQSTARAGHRD